MPKITYVEFNGTEHPVQVASGLTVMEGAVKNRVPGIEAECGGACACATCHVYVEGGWLETVGGAGAMEESMLEFADGVELNSRLSCQVRVTEALEGLVVRMPRSQR